MELSNVTRKQYLNAKTVKADLACKDDPKLFFETFLYTFDPKREPYHWAFHLYPYEADLVDNIVRHIEQGQDLFVEKCREMGVTYTTLGVLLWYWKYQEAANFLVGSRKEDIVDNVGKTGDGEVSNKEESLFGKLDYMIEKLPAIILPTGFNPKMHRTYMSLRNPENGNVIAGESANPNFSRGGRQKAILLDEFAFWDNDNTAWGATADTTNCRIILTTPGIRPNTKAKRLRFGKDGEKIDMVTLTYNLDPRKDEEWIEQQRERRSSEDFAREIMIDWEGSTAGVVYKEAKNRTVGNFPYQPTQPLFISWDFGLDGVAIQWWQYDLKTGKHWLLDAYMNTDRPIEWYFPFIGKDIQSKYDYDDEALRTIMRTKNYRNARHYGDPDVNKRSLLTGTSTRETLEEVGIYVQTNPKSNDFASRREKTKVLLQAGYDINETPGTNYWIECIDSARYPQREQTSQATSEISKPIHDWTSHHRTATEYYAVNFTDPSIKREVGPVLMGEANEDDAKGVYINEKGEMEAYHIDIGKMIKKNNQDTKDWRTL